MATHIRRREFRVTLSGTVALPLMARVSNVVTLTSFLLLLCGDRTGHHVAIQCDRGIANWHDCPSDRRSGPRLFSE
jgi:hypothetical protein